MLVANVAEAACSQHKQLRRFGERVWSKMLELGGCYATEISNPLRTLGRTSLASAEPSLAPRLATLVQTTNNSRDSIKMRILLSSTAVCRHLSRNGFLRIQRPSLSPWPWLHTVRHISSGMFAIM
jgi:hypothetical protein